MTYKEIIDIFKKKVQGHFFVNEFGYGDISDIMTPDDGKAPYYPYIFLNPVSVSSNSKVSSFNFNLICMTQALDDEISIIKKQSDCIDNLRDIIARVNNTLIDPLVEIQEPFTFTPFKERFQDDVVGASCNLTVTYPTLLDACNTPIADPNYCLVARDFSTDINIDVFNTTYKFGGWGYWKYYNNEYISEVGTQSPIDGFEFICDTRYAYFVSDEKRLITGDPIYPVMMYFDTGYPDSVSPNLSGYYITFLTEGNTFECGAKTSILTFLSTNNAVSYVNTTSDNGWIIPDEGWIKTFNPNNSGDRTGNVYIFKTDCTDPNPKPTSAPQPPPTSTPTPTATPTVTPTTSPVIPTPTPTTTSTQTPTPTITSTSTPTVTPTNTSTSTPTPTPTNTSTTTPTLTPTNTQTPTSSSTPTPTITSTSTSTPTPTLTPTNTSTPTPTPTPSTVTYHIEAQNGDLIITQGGDFIDWFPL